MDNKTALTADPWRDTDVIDAHAPRFNQGTVGVVGAVALLTGWWWLFGLRGRPRRRRPRAPSVEPRAPGPSLAP